MTAVPDTPAPDRPQMTPFGQAELVNLAVQELRAVATAILAERSQVNECLADPGETWRRRAVHVAQELAFQADKLRDQATRLEQVAADLERGNGA